MFNLFIQVFLDGQRLCLQKLLDDRNIFMIQEDGLPLLKKKRNLEYIGLSLL